MLLLDSSVCSLFKWRQFEPEVILLAVGWYLRFSLSYRDVEELLAERGSFYELPELLLIPVSSNDVRNFPLHPAVVHNFLSEPHEICDFQAAAILCRIANQTRLQLFDLLQKGLLILLIEHEIISYS
jgi:hypothetical protein